MKLIILHGDYVIKSYERLERFISTAKDRGWEISDYDKETVDNQSLFAVERFVILRDYQTLSKKDILGLDKYPGTLIIYHEGNIPQAFLKMLTNPVIEEFKLPKIIFTMLDSIYPGNVKEVLTLFHQAIENNPPEFLFALIARLFRDLYSIPPAYPSWRIQKLKKQSQHFTQNKLKEIIGLLSEIDVKVKTSKANLISSLDLLIIKHLE